MTRYNTYTERKTKGQRNTGNTISGAPPRRLGLDVFFLAQVTAKFPLFISPPWYLAGMYAIRRNNQPSNRTISSYVSHL